MRAAGRAAGTGSAVGNATNSPEAFPGYHDLPYYVTQATWSSPVSNRLLLDAGFSRFHYRFAGNGQVPPDGLTDLIPVTEQSTIYGLANFSYRGLYDPNAHAFADNKASSIQWRASASYVTGAHNFKIGYMGSSLVQTSGRVANDSQLRYTFNNRNPVSFGYVLAPRWDTTDHTMTAALFVAGSMDAGQADAPGGDSLRPRLELGAGRGQRHDGDVDLQPAADLVRAHGERQGLQRHHTARGRRV